MIFDVEANGLLDEATKIHCLAYEKNNKVYSTTSYEEMRKVITNAKTLIGHNIIEYDIPLLEKLLSIKIEARPIDTLALSWYINHRRNIHGLDSYGRDYGVPKPKIDNWENLTPEEYLHRCEEDVKINSMLWKDLRKGLLSLYDNHKEADRLISYLMFKMDCAREQARSGWLLDKEAAQKHHDVLFEEGEKKILALKNIMPVVIKTAKRTKPAKPYKKDGTLSVTGAKWSILLKEHNLPEDYDGEVIVPVGEEEPNPNSTDQLKKWLYSMGWEPITFNYVKDKETGDERKVEQIRRDGDEGKELCPSVLRLLEKEPKLKVLEGLSIIQHRLAIFKGFLKNEKDGYVKAEISGLTNTLRFKHRSPCVNLPGVDKPWGKEIRGCLIAPKGYELCGADMVSLEETTKKHYMYPHDPEFVAEMSREGFDAHLDLARHAGAATQEEITAYVFKKDGAKNLKPIRSKFKAANYSCIYGVGGPKLAREIGVALWEAVGLIEAYWERNHAVKTVIEEQDIRTINGQMWLKNPVSGFLYSLRYKKDIFSTLNQGTGVYCFDSWIKEWRKLKPQLTGQFHDEIIKCLPKGHRDQCTKLLKEAIERVNDKLQLNVKLDVDVQYGDTYADIH